MSIPHRLAYGIEEAAELIGMAPSYLRDAVTARRIRHRLLGKGRGVRFTISDLETLLDSCVVEPEKPLTRKEAS